MASFDENGKYIKTNWKAGDKITATKLNKIEESIEAVNDNDISRHVEADARLDALEAKDVAHDKEFTNVKNTIANNKAAAELGDYEINSRMTFLEDELNEGIEEVHNVAETVDGKITTAEANMTAQVNTAKNEMTAQVNQGKADMEAMVAEVEADLEGLHAKDEELSEQLAQKANDSEVKTNLTINENIISNLRIAFHYNYENNQEKILKLKRLGFNCIWLYNQASFVKDVNRLIPFLNRLQENGIKCILQLDYNGIINNDSDTISYVNSIKNHKAVIGFTGFDEPIGHAISKTNQETFYTNLKLLSDKLIFQVDTDSSYNSMINYYSEKTYDVFCIDVYTNLETYTSSNERKGVLFDRINGFMNYTESKSPKYFIPIIPTFEGGGHIKSNIDIIKEYIDVLSVFNIKSYGFFAFHIEDSNYKTIDNDLDLENCVIYFNNSFLNSTQNIFSLKPRGFNFLNEYVSHINFVFNSQTFSKIGVGKDPKIVNEIIYKVNRNSSNDLLVISLGLRQYQDANKRSVIIEYSYDNSEYVQIKNVQFGAKPSGMRLSAYATVSNDTSCIFVKIKIDASDLTGNQEQAYIGITNLNISFV